MTYTTTTTLSTDTLELIAEWHAAHTNLDPVTTAEAAAHDAMHAYLGLGVSVEEEDLVQNCVEILQGGECLPQHQERCELLLSLLSNEVLVELTIALN